MKSKNQELMTDMGHAAKHTSVEKSVLARLNEAFETSALPLENRLQAFPRHVRRQDIARFLAKYEMFKQVLDVNGSIVECGVYVGTGLSSWLQFSSILEPYNHTTRIIGFDTFAGFPSVHEKDLAIGTSEHLKVGGLHSSQSTKAELENLIAIHDQNRPIGHIPKVILVEGDAMDTMPRFVEEHPHTLIRLLYLDFDLYAPTKRALEVLYSRVVKGGIVAFDEANCAEFPGETVALLEMLDLKDVRLKRFPYEPYLSYFIKE